MSPVLYAVIHEYQSPDGRVSYGAASSAWDNYEAADNQLGYCLALQESGKRGTEGRYYIAEITEAPNE